MAKQTFTTGQVLTAAQMTSLQQTAMGGGDATPKTASYVLVAADAGTTVAMNAAGSTTITVNTGLFSAGDTVFIQNRGAGTCTITAGTATVNTHGSLALGQYEGGQLYFTATGAAIFFDISQSTGMTNPMTTTGDTIYSSSGSTPARLGIGSTGQVLTVAGGVPSWATPASGGGLTLLSTTTLSGASTSITIDPTGYINLCIVGENVRFAGNDYGQIELNSSTTNTYVSAKFAGGSGTFQGYASQAIIYFVANTAATGSNNNVFSMNIYNVDQTASWKNWDIRSVYKQSSDSTQVVQHMGGAVHTTSTITNFVISPSGNTWTSGTIKVYGVK